MGLMHGRILILELVNVNKAIFSEFQSTTSILEVNITTHFMKGCVTLEANVPSGLLNVE